MKFQRKVLQNGITVIHESRDLPLVSLSITNKFGAAFEESKIKGIAHFIEHLLFTGTKTRTHEKIASEIEKKGGVLNAFTSHEVTSYWFKLPSEHIFAGLNIITDMVKNPAFEKEKFEKEKKVILEEIKMYHDAPSMHVFEQIEKNMFEKPFGELIIGSKETVSSIDRDFVADYFEKMYSPENYIVTIVGSCDFEKVCQFLEENFSPKNKQLTIIPVKKKNSNSIEERPGIDQAHLVFAMHAPLPLDPKHSVLEVLDAYLANGMSSRLFLEIREKRGLAYAVQSNIDSEKNYSVYRIYVGTMKEAIEEVKKTDHTRIPKHRKHDSRKPRRSKTKSNRPAQSHLRRKLRRHERTDVPRAQWLRRRLLPTRRKNQIRLPRTSQIARRLANQRIQHRRNRS